MASIAIAVMIFYAGTIAISDYFDRFYYCEGLVYFSKDHYGLLLSGARFSSIFILSMTLDYFFRFTFMFQRKSIDSRSKNSITIEDLKQSFKDNARKDYLVNQFVY